MGKPRLCLKEKLKKEEATDTLLERNIVLHLAFEELAQAVADHRETRGTMATEADKVLYATLQKAVEFK